MCAVTVSQRTEPNFGELAKAFLDSERLSWVIWPGGGYRNLLAGDIRRLTPESVERRLDRWMARKGVPCRPSWVTNVEQCVHAWLPHPSGPEVQDIIARTKKTRRELRLAECSEARQMTTQDIQDVMQKFPDLSADGFEAFRNHSHRLTRQEWEERFAVNRRQLLESADECSAICEWLRDKKKRHTINKKRSSYGLKHVAESELGFYVSNGAFICAAVFCGFRIRKSPPNAYFNIAEDGIQVPRSWQIR